MILYKKRVSEGGGGGGEEGGLSRGEFGKDFQAIRSKRFYVELFAEDN